MDQVCIKSDAATEELRYVCNWLFGEIYGVEWRIEDGGKEGLVCLECGGRTLELNGEFFSLADSDWGKANSVGRFFEVEGCGTGALYGERLPNGAWIEECESGLRCGVDVFGSLFVLMSRYEEMVNGAEDEHGRFPESASVVPADVSAQRAVGNELIEFLWKLMERCFAGIERSPREFRVLPTHDIDKAGIFRNSRFLGNVKRAICGGTTSRFGKGRLAYLHCWNNVNQGKWEEDPYDTIDWICDESEKRGLCSAFYYIPECTDLKMDMRMPMEHAHVRDQWQRISQRGHELGMHPGYYTFDDRDRIVSGVERVRKQMDELGIVQEEIGGRQHFLRWKVAETPRHWDAAGMSYDSTVGWANQAGFRSGLCYEYPMYDLVERKPLQLRQRPLVLMECSVIDERYSGLGTGEEAFQAMSQVKAECRKYQGDFVLLWHNQRFVDEREKNLYRAILDA